MAKVLVRVPDVTRAAGHGNALANRVPGRIKNAPLKDGKFGTPVTISCDDRAGYSLSIKNNSVVLVPTNSSDPSQKWDKDDSWDDGFAIVNENTKQAIQRPSGGAGHRLLLVKYDPTNWDSSVMWKQDTPTSCPICEHDDATLVFDYTQRGDDFLAIVSKDSKASTQKWTMKDNK